MTEALRKSLTVQAYLPVCLFADVVLALKKKGVLLSPAYSSYVRELFEEAHRRLKASHFNSPSKAISFLATEGFSVSQLSQKERGRGLRLDLAEEDRQEKEAPERPSPARASEIAALFESLQEESSSDE